MKYLKLLTAHENIDTSIYNMKYSCVAKCLDVAEHNKTSMHYSTIATRFPLPNDYAEVEYIQNGREDCIVIDDLLIKNTTDFGVKCKIWTVSKGCFMGAGHNNGSSYSYGISLWHYHYHSGSSNNIVFWGTGSDGGMQAVLTNLPVSPAPFVIDLYKPSGGKQQVEIRYSTDSIFYKRVNYKKSAGLGFTSGNYGPFAFFNEVIYDAGYPGYYGWPTSYRPTSNAHRPYDNRYGAGLGTKLYSHIMFYAPSSNTVTKFLYTCYKKSTHQYGLYDAINNVFYGGFTETTNNYWSNQNYYWDNIETATGETISAKEKTFLNICGPDDE